MFRRRWSSVSFAPVFAAATTGLRALILPMVVAVVPLLVASSIRAGTVETIRGKFEGEIAFQPDAVKVGDTQIAFEDILYLHADPSSDRPPCPNLVRLKNGEVWAGQIVSGSSKKIDVRCDWYGQKSFDLDSISALEFVPRRPAPAGTKLRTLYREQHQPLPGDLMWIDEDSLGVDSPLGSVTIKREGLVRYLLADRPLFSPVGDSDEVGLIDGNVFRGRLRTKAGQLGLEHEIGGRATFPADTVCYVVRHNPTMIELSSLASKVMKTGEGTLDKGKQAAVSHPLIAAASGTRFIRAWRVEPKINIRYALPKRDGRRVFCRATFEPIRGARGDTRIKLLVGRQTVLDRTLSATDRPQPIDVRIPEGDELIIDVDFGALLRFPCGLLMQDAHLILVK